MNAGQRNGWAELGIRLAPLAVLILVANHQRIGAELRRLDTWLAGRPLNWSRLEWMKRYAAAGGYADDMRPDDDPQEAPAAGV